MAIEMKVGGGAGDYVPGELGADDNAGYTSCFYTACRTPTWCPLDVFGKFPIEIRCRVFILKKALVRFEREKTSKMLHQG